MILSHWLFKFRQCFSHRLAGTLHCRIPSRLNGRRRSGFRPEALETRVLLATVQLAPVADNTLYEDADGQLSNGAGEYLFAGNSQESNAHRALIEFDVESAVPAGSVIESAELRLHMSRTMSGPEIVDVHRVLADWGEGTSDAADNEGMGAPSTLNDATWTNTFFPSSFWTTLGGDFSTTVSAGTTVNAFGTYTWSGPQLTSDVLAWLNDPSSNFGWLLRGDESVPQTAKRFDSRENADPNSRPLLTIVFAEPSNAAPATIADIGTTDEDHPLIIPVLDNDTDPEGDQIFVAGISSALTNGSVSLNPDGTVTYDPSGRFESLDQNRSLVDTFYYTAEDENGQVQVPVDLSGSQEVGPVDTAATGSAIVTLDTVSREITITGSFSGLEGIVTAAHLHGPASATATAGVLFGLTLAGATSGTFSGTATLSPENVTNVLSGLTYINVHSTDHGLGEIRGQVLGSAVRVTVTGVNDAPVSNPLQVATDEDSPVNFNADATDVEADPLTVAGLDTFETAGTVTVNADGTLRYDPRGQFDALAAGESATDTFRYVVQDDSGLSQLSAVLQGAQEVPPVSTSASGSAVATVDTSTGRVTVTGSFSGLEGSVTGIHLHGPAPAGIEADILFGLSVDGGTSGTFSGSAVLPADEAANVLRGLTYVNVHSTVHAGGELRGQVVGSSVTVTVHGVDEANSAPTAGDDEFGTDEDTVVMVPAPGVLGNDVDPDGPGALTVIPFGGLVVFGDSLSDTGNLFAASGGTTPPSPPYFVGRFSNGPVWVEHLAQTLGLEPASVRNLAVGGSTSSDVVNFQLPSFATIPESTGSLYVIWIGANDLLNASDPLASVGPAVANIEHTLTQLSFLGAHEFLVPNLPDLGRIPSTQETNDPLLIQAATAASQQFNAALGASLDMLESTLGVAVTLVDIFGLYNDVVADPAAFGFVNVTERALSPGGTVVPNPNEYLFWDQLHPTTAAHAGIADFAAAALGLSETNASFPLTSTRNVSVTMHADGRFVYDPTAVGSLQALAPGQSVVDTFNYFVSDGAGGTDSATVAVTVAGVNDAPTAVNDTAFTSEDAPVVISVVVNDVDAENDPLTVAGVATFGTTGAVTISNRSIIYDPADLFEMLDNGESATTTFRYLVQDSRGLVQVTVPLEGTQEESPVTTPGAGTATIRLDVNTGAITIAGSFSGLESNATAAHLHGPADPGMSTGVIFALTVNGGTAGTISGSSTLSAAHVQELLAGRTYVNIHSTAHATGELRGQVVGAAVTVTITGADEQNVPPIAVDDAATTDEDTPVTIPVLSNDIDADSGDVLTLQSLDLTGTQGTTVINANGTVTYDPNGQFEGLAAGATASDRFRYTAVDVDGLTSTAEVIVTITGVDDQPGDREFRFATVADGVADTYTLRLNGANLEIRDNVGAVLASTPTAGQGGDVERVIVTGSADDDAFLIDFFGGNPIPAGGVDFDGGGQGANGDSLLLLNGSATLITHRFADQHSGEIAIDGRLVRYAGLEPLFDNLDAVHRVFTFGDADDVVTLDDDDTSNNGFSEIFSFASSETVVFMNPTGSLTVHAGGGGDVLDVVDLDGLLASSVTITLDAGAGDDLIDAAVVRFYMRLNGRAGDDTLLGGDGDDVLFGSAGRDSLDGGDGNDVVMGQGGSFDSLSGGDGNDHLDGGAGTDLVLESGDVNFVLSDTRLVGLGTDELRDVERAILSTGSGNNVIDASGYFDDTVPSFGSVRTTLLGGAGNDSIVGSRHNDEVDGGDGDDTVQAGDHADRISGGRGRDWLDGGSGNDVISGQADADLIFGGGGNDRMTGGGGNDRLLGGNGDDTFSGGSGDDILQGGDGDDALRGDDGRDGLSGGDDDDRLYGGDANDTLAGGSGNDTLLGNDGQDIGLGQSGDDIVDGRGGRKDTLAGGDGDDSVIGDLSEIDETFTFSARWLDGV